MEHQPNSDTAHDHTYPMTAEGLRTFDLRPMPERFDTWCSALERRIEELEQRASHLERIVHIYINRNEGDD